MDKELKRPRSKVQKKLDGQADISDADNSVKLENQNQNHNTKKVALGPNTKR